jgi:hypothetical protein
MQECGSDNIKYQPLNPKTPSTSLAPDPLGSSQLIEFVATDGANGSQTVVKS